MKGFSNDTLQLKTELKLIAIGACIFSFFATANVFLDSFGLDEYAIDKFATLGFLNAFVAICVYRPVRAARQIEVLKKRRQSLDERTLGDLLASEKGRLSLYKFLKKEFASENLLFWLAVEDMLEEGRANHDTVLEIASRFIGADAPYEVNISSATLKEFQNSLPDVHGWETPERKAKCMKALFKAKNEVFTLIEKDSFSRYRLWNRDQFIVDNPAIKSMDVLDAKAPTHRVSLSKTLRLLGGTSSRVGDTFERFSQKSQKDKKEEGKTTKHSTIVARSETCGKLVPVCEPLSKSQIESLQPTPPTSPKSLSLSLQDSTVATTAAASSSPVAKMA
jgi:hypothetical protein